MHPLYVLLLFFLLSHHFRYSVRFNWLQADKCFSSVLLWFKFEAIVLSQLWFIITLTYKNEFVFQQTHFSCFLTIDRELFTFFIQIIRFKFVRPNWNCIVVRFEANCWCTFLLKFFSYKFFLDWRSINNDPICLPFDMTIISFQACHIISNIFTKISSKVIYFDEF